MMCLGVGRECDVREAPTPKLDPGARHITVPMVNTLTDMSHNLQVYSILNSEYLTVKLV